MHTEKLVETNWNFIYFPPCKFKLTTVVSRFHDLLSRQNTANCLYCIFVSRYVNLHYDNGFLLLVFIYLLIHTYNDVSEKKREIKVAF